MPAIISLKATTDVNVDFHPFVVVARKAPDTPEDEGGIVFQEGSPRSRSALNDRGNLVWHDDRIRRFGTGLLNAGTRRDWRQNRRFSRGHFGLSLGRDGTLESQSCLPQL